MKRQIVQHVGKAATGVWIASVSGAPVIGGTDLPACALSTSSARTGEVGFAPRRAAALTSIPPQAPCTSSEALLMSGDFCASDGY